MLIPSITEIQRFFGSDVTPNGIACQFATRWKNNVKQLKDADAARMDCKGVNLDGGKGQIRFFISYSTLAFPLLS
jgi:hypothetical protein